MITAPRSLIARSISRVIFSPTAEPIEPPMKFMSMAAAKTRWPPTFPRALMTASADPLHAGLFKAFRVRLAVDESERIGGDHFGVELFAISVIENLFEALVGAEAKVIIAVMQTFWFSSKSFL